MSYEVVGKPVPRADAAEKVTGRARYTADVNLPGTLWGKALLSPYPHARIARMDTTAAGKLPGVHAVLTGEDVRGHLYGRVIKDVPVLAVDRVRFVGDRVAAVAADDEDVAQAALDLIEVEYEELPAVFEPVEAMAPGAPILHPDFNSYAGVIREGAGTAPPAMGGFRFGVRALAEPSNAYARQSREHGDVEKGFAEADFVFENTYQTQRQHHAFIEPQSVFVWDDTASGRVHVWVCNKVPYNIKTTLADAIGVPAEKVLVHPTFIGGDFGGKSAPTDLPIAYFLSKAAGRPVKMVHDYIEEFGAGNPRHAMTYRLKTGVKRDGTITAHQVSHYVNCGAYAGYKPGGIIMGANQAAGPYKIPNVKIESVNVYTNTLPGQIMRAPGEPQAIFAIESQIDEVARGIGMDPVEFRLKNLVESGEEMAAGEALEDVAAKDLLRAAVQAAGYHDPKPAFVGRGVAVGDRGAGGGQANAAVTLRPDGRVILGTPVFDQGSGTYTTLRQVVAEELHIPSDQIEVEPWDTDSVPFDAGVAGSRQTRIATQVAYQAAQETKKALLALAARTLGCPEEKLTLRGSEIWRTDIEERIGWRALLSRAGESVKGEAHITDMERLHFTSFIAQVAEVSVDPETGEIKLLKFTTAHDVGQIINPIGHQGQINGGVLQGVGYALMEELRVEDGRVTNPSFGDYKIPTTRDLPELRTVLLPAERGIGPYNIKAIGEHPTIPVAPAIINAIHDACGVRIRDLPATAEKVYRELRSKG